MSARHVTLAATMGQDLLDRSLARCDPDEPFADPVTVDWRWALIREQFDRIVKASLTAVCDHGES